MALPLVSSRWPKPSMMIKAVGFFGPSAFLAAAVAALGLRPRLAAGFFASVLAAVVFAAAVLRVRFAAGFLQEPDLPEH